jgi:hypothetical protein
MPMNAHNIRVDDTLWSLAGIRAVEEGTDRSTLIRQWLQDYVDTGQATSGGKDRAKIRALQRVLKQHAEALAVLAKDD